MHPVVLLFLALLSAVSAAAPGERVFEFTYTVNGEGLPADRPVDVYIPLPRNTSGQKIISESVSSSLPGRLGSEPVYGNAYYHIHRPAGSRQPLDASLSWTVSRSRLGTEGDTELEIAEKERFLSPNRLVPVGHEILDPILLEVYRRRGEDTPAATARAIYDWVVDNVQYRKVGTGWGNGDTFWACSERYGNCTDFHALFVSLARTEGIPARFEIGFPVPADRRAGDIGGYHCWVRFHLPGQGWIPIDASEAAKHPEQRELLYGAHPADRIHFTTGRDLVISEATRARPLNYFVYPHVEVDGEVWGGKLDTRFSFRQLPVDNTVADSSKF
jgi:transglutaminase-like putative cysteine protease